MHELRRGTRDRELGVADGSADERVGIVPNIDGVAVVAPVGLDELELALDVGHVGGEEDPAVHPVVRGSGVERRAVGHATAYDPLTDRERVAEAEAESGVGPADVGTERAAQSFRIVRVVERVDAFGVGSDGGIRLVRGEGERRPVGPSPDQLRHQLLVRQAHACGLLVNPASEQCHFFVQLAPHQERAVEKEGLVRAGRRMAVGIDAAVEDLAEREAMPMVERVEVPLAGAWVVGAAHRRLPDPVGVAEMLLAIRQPSTPLRASNDRVMAFETVTESIDHSGQFDGVLGLDVEQRVHPTGAEGRLPRRRRRSADVAQSLRPGGHAFAERGRERGQHSRRHTECGEAGVRERHVERGRRLRLPPLRARDFAQRGAQQRP